MSLKSKYKTTSALAREGVWFDLEPNSDGSVPRFKMRPSGRSNPKWGPVFRDNTADKDMDAVSSEEDEIITANIFAEANIVEWENFQPEDDGVNLEFSLENAKAILTDPDWIKFLNHLQTLVNKAEPFQDFTAKRKAEAGN